MSLPVSSNPWVVLNLDGATATEADIKRAYAALLKEHRPDRDPANFQRLRDARDEAMERLKGRVKIECPPAPIVEPEPEVAGEPPPLAIPLPEPAASPPPLVQFRPLSLQSPLQDAIARKDTAAIRQALEDLKLDPRRWSQAVLMAWHMPGAKDLIDAAIDPADFVPAVDDADADADAALAWLRHMIALRNFNRPATLAAALLATIKGDLSAPGAIELYYRLAKALAVSHPELAQPLADQAYLASPTYRRQFENVSRWVFIGQQFASLPAEVRYEWNRVLHRAEAGERFFDEPFLGALMLETRRTMRNDWLGYRIIREFLPAGLYAKIKGPAERILLPRRRNRGGFPVWRIITVIFIVSGMLPILLNNISRSVKTPAIRDLYFGRETAIPWPDLIEQRQAHLKKVSEQSAEVQAAYRALESRGVQALPAILHELPQTGEHSIAAKVIDLYVDAPGRAELPLMGLPAVVKGVLSEPQKLALGRKLLARPMASAAFQAAIREHLLAEIE